MASGIINTATETTIALVYADGVKTIGALLNELFAVADWITDANKMSQTKLVIGHNVFYPVYFVVNSQYQYTRETVSSTHVSIDCCNIKATGSTWYNSTDGTIADNSSAVPSNGTHFEIVK